MRKISSAPFIAPWIRLLPVVAACLGLVLTAAPCRGAAAAEPLSLAESGSSSLAGHLELFDDPSAKLAFREVLSLADSGRFRPIPGLVNRGYTDDAVWVRFALTRPPSYPEDSFLRLSPPFLDYVTVYVQTGANPADSAAYQEYRLGDHIPAAERPVRHSDFVVPLELPVGPPRLVYIRIRTTSVVNLAGEIHTT